MHVLQRPLAPVSSVPTSFDVADYSVADCWWSGFGLGCDGFRLDVPADLPANLIPSFVAGYRSGFDNYETQLLSDAATAGEFDPRTEDAAEWLGFRLGLDGELAELASPDAAERSAFERGHNAGDDYLWRVDPDFAAHCQARVGRAETSDQSEPTGTWSDAELTEVGAFLQLMPVFGGVL